MNRFFQLFKRTKPEQTESEIVGRVESIIHSALAMQEFDVLLQRITPIIAQKTQLVSAEERKVLNELAQAWGIRFIHYQLFAAFIRGFRHGDDGNRLTSADVETDKELRFLSHNSQIDIGLSCAGKINDYFCDATWLFIKTDYSAARLAALTAGAVAQADQREGLLGYLGDVANDWRMRTTELTSVPDRLESLATDIAGSDWTIEDIAELKGQLKSIEPEFFYCLIASDPSVFRARYPKLFEEHDIWFS